MCLTEELKDRYRKFLEKLAKDKSGELFSNGGKDHAIVLYQVLLNHASGEVRIFCEGGVSDIWQDEGVQKSMVSFISKEDSKIKILTENYTEESFPEIRDNAKVEIHQVSQSGIAEIHEHFDNRNCNFAVFNPNMFRYEYDKREYKAYGSFNDKEISDSMIALFDSVWEREESR